MNKKEEFQYYLTRFLTKYMAGQRNLSQNTISSYAYTFKLLLNFFSAEKNIRSDKITLDKLTKDNIIGFLDWLEQTRGVTIASRNIRLAGIHSFIKYLQTEDPSHLFEYQKILSIKNIRVLKFHTFHSTKLKLFWLHQIVAVDRDSEIKYC